MNHFCGVAEAMARLGILASSKPRELDGRDQCFDVAREVIHVRDLEGKELDAGCGAPAVKCRSFFPVTCVSR